MSIHSLFYFDNKYFNSFCKIRRFAFVYRIIANRAEITSKRRVVAAALAGYAAINASAFCASIEFGIQPILFHDASGAPLYAPYPLSIAIPAMMIGHLTFAGLAELITAGGVVAYLQRSDPSLLKLTAPDALNADVMQKSGWRSTRPLWIGLAALMILTPLGLLAAGTAWGEWKAQDFADPAVRERISASSNNQTAPDAPPFMSSPQFGYILSAMFGTGLIIAIFLLISWIAKAVSRNHQTETGNN